MTSLEAARADFSSLCIGGNDSSTPGVGVSSATFQPVAARANEDNMTFKTWEIAGQKWILMVVCDGKHLQSSACVSKKSSEYWLSIGHSGSYITADYTTASLPPRLHASLQDVLANQLHGQIECETLLENAGLISSALSREVERFDDELGNAIKEIFPHPEKLTKARCYELLKAHYDVVQRAYRGCTLGAALINVTARCMWTLNVGDTTAGKHNRAKDASH